MAEVIGPSSSSPSCLGFAAAAGARLWRLGLFVLDEALCLGVFLDKF